VVPRISFVAIEALDGGLEILEPQVAKAMAVLPWWLNQRPH